MNLAFRIVTTFAIAVCVPTLAPAQCDYPLKPPKRQFSPGDIRARYSNLIFRIFAGGSQGTAFAIDPGSGYFLTAQHVVDNIDQNGVRGDLESDADRKFKFQVVMKLCTQEYEGECKNLGGEVSDPGVDIALLRMTGEDLKDYLSLLGSAEASFDLSLSFQPPDEAFKAGFPHEGNPDIPAILDPSDQMNVVRDWGVGDRALIHRQWKLDRTASDGESGSPVMDGSGNIFGILLEQDPADSNKGISISLLEAIEALKKIFKDMPRTSVGKRLGTNIASNSYKSAAETARDLRPGLITNKELAAVILDVTEKGPPSFRFKHCPVDIALNDRGLDGIYSNWESDEANVDLTQQRTVLLRDANGLLASGQLDAAAERYEQLLSLKPPTRAPSGRDIIALDSALGAARVYQLMQDPTKEMEFSDLALHLAYIQGSKDHVALASTYRFNAALADGKTASAVRNAKISFIQAPETVYSTLESKEDKEKFRVTTSNRLTAEEWQSFMNVQQTTLETKLLDATSGEIKTAKSK